MYSLNKAQIIGNVTRDIEIRQLPSGIPVASFSIATNRVWNDSNGVRQEKAEFHDCVAWRKLAEIAGQLLKKGTKTYVEGRLETREWTGEDGIKRRKTEIIVDNLIVLSPKGFDTSRQDVGLQKPVADLPVTPTETVAAVKPAEEEVTIDDLPF